MPSITGHQGNADQTAARSHLAPTRMAVSKLHITRTIQLLDVAPQRQTRMGGCLGLGAGGRGRAAGIGYHGHGRTVRRGEASSNWVEWGLHNNVHSQSLIELHMGKFMVCTSHVYKRFFSVSQSNSWFVISPSNSAKSCFLYLEVLLSGTFKVKISYIFPINQTSWPLSNELFLVVLLDIKYIFFWR